MREKLLRIISDLEYSAFNLCEEKDGDVDQRIIESTCPEKTLLLAIRALKDLACEDD